MTVEANTDDGRDACGQAATVSAYLDGELAGDDAARFEAHARECGFCTGAVNEQKRVLCLLDAALMRRAAGAGGFELPKDFARVVTARAQTNMRGVRCGDRSERKRALLWCAILFAASVSLLGAAGVFGAAVEPLAGAGRAAASVFGMLWHALGNAGSGAVVVLRAFGGVFGAGANSAVKILALSLLAGALVLLLRLIGSYHRAAARAEES